MSARLRASLRSRMRSLLQCRMRSGPRYRSPLSEQRLTPLSGFDYPMLTSVPPRIPPPPGSLQSTSMIRRAAASASASFRACSRSRACRCSASASSACRQRRSRFRSLNGRYRRCTPRQGSQTGAVTKIPPQQLQERLYDAPETPDDHAAELPPEERHDKEHEQLEDEQRHVRAAEIKQIVPDALQPPDDVRAGHFLLRLFSVNRSDVIAVAGTDPDRPNRLFCRQAIASYILICC
jgi:hypothetical protein